MTKAGLQPFPVDVLKPSKARLAGSPDVVSVEIDLQRFALPIEDGVREEFETSIRLDGFALPPLDRGLIGQTFHFPFNPEPGYIDGSVYVSGAHHPVDVSEVAFRTGRDGDTITIRAILLCEFEGLGDFGDTAFVLTAPLELPEVADRKSDGWLSGLIAKLKSRGA